MRKNPIENTGTEKNNLYGSGNFLMKITIAGLMKDTNIGDQIIADVFTNLFKETAFNEASKDYNSRINDGYEFGRSHIPLCSGQKVIRGGGLCNLKIWIFMGEVTDVKKILHSLKI